MAPRGRKRSRTTRAVAAALDLRPAAAMSLIRSPVLARSFRMMTDEGEGAGATTTGATTRDGCLTRLEPGRILLVGHVRQPLDGGAVERLLDRDVRHRGR